MREDPILKSLQEQQRLEEERKQREQYARSIQREQERKTQRRQEIESIKKLIPDVLDLLKRAGYPDTKKLLPKLVVSRVSLWGIRSLLTKAPQQQLLHKAIAGWLINLSKMGYVVDRLGTSDSDYHFVCDLILVYLLSDGKILIQEHKSVDGQLPGSSNAAREFRSRFHTNWASVATRSHDSLLLATRREVPYDVAAPTDAFERMDDHKIHLCYHGLQELKNELERTLGG